GEGQPLPRRFAVRPRDPRRDAVPGRPPRDDRSLRPRVGRAARHGLRPRRQSGQLAGLASLRSRPAGRPRRDGLVRLVKPATIAAVHRLLPLLFSLVAPGAGHAYIGRPVRGAAFTAAFLGALASVPLTLVIGVLVMGVAYLGAAVDVIVCARPTDKARPIF